MSATLLLQLLQVFLRRGHLLPKLFHFARQLVRLLPQLMAFCREDVGLLLQRLQLRVQGGRFLVLALQLGTRLRDLSGEVLARRGGHVELMGEALR
jgi:hypothetical protein